jgi:hypothetical protein
MFCTPALTVRAEAQIHELSADRFFVEAGFSPHGTFQGAARCAHNRISYGGSSRLCLRDSVSIYSMVVA